MCLRAGCILTVAGCDADLGTGGRHCPDPQNCICRQAPPAEVRVVGIQAECASAYYLSWKRGSAVSTDTCNTIADGLATRTPIEDNVAAIRQLVDDVRLVTEDQMLRAIDLLVKEHVVAEPAGAAATAAWLADSTTAPRRPIVLFVTGSNIAEPILRRTLTIGEKS